MFLEQNEQAHTMRKYSPDQLVTILKNLGIVYLSDKTPLPDSRSDQGTTPTRIRLHAKRSALAEASNMREAGDETTKDDVPESGPASSETVFSHTETEEALDDQPDETTIRTYARKNLPIPDNKEALTPDNEEALTEKRLPLTHEPPTHTRSNDGFAAQEEMVQSSTEMSAVELIQELATTEIPRIRDASIALFLLHPELADDASEAWKTSPTQIADQIATLILATLYLQRLWASRLTSLSIHTTTFPEEPFEEIWTSWQLPSPNEQFGMTGLYLLEGKEQQTQNTQAHLISDWQNQVTHLIQQAQWQRENQIEPLSPADIFSFADEQTPPINAPSNTVTQPILDETHPPESEELRVEPLPSSDIFTSIDTQTTLNDALSNTATPPTLDEERSSEPVSESEELQMESAPSSDIIPSIEAQTSSASTETAQNPSVTQSQLPDTDLETDLPFAATSSVTMNQSTVQHTQNTASQSDIHEIDPTDPATSPIETPPSTFQPDGVPDQIEGQQRNRRERSLAPVDSAQSVSGTSSFSTAFTDREKKNAPQKSENESEKPVKAPFIVNSLAAETSASRAVTQTDIEQFLLALGKSYHKRARIYLTGSSSLIHLGLRPGVALTIDVLPDAPDEEEMITAIRQTGERQQIDVLFTSPEDFVPIPIHWKTQTRYIVRYGTIEAYYFDFYSLALSKIERGSDRDLYDLRLLIEQNIINLKKLEETYREVLPRMGKRPYLNIIPQRFSEFYEWVYQQLKDL